MDLPSEMAVTFTLPTTRHPVAIPMPTLAIITAHRAGTTTEALSPGHFWQEEVIIILHQTKWKHFTKQPKNCGIVFNFKLDSQLRYYTVLSRGNTFFLTRQYKKKYILICKFNIEAWARLHKTPVTTTGIRTCTRDLSELH